MPDGGSGYANAMARAESLTLVVSKLKQAQKICPGLFAESGCLLSCPRVYL